jgi:hypothetical protein
MKGRRLPPETPVAPASAIAPGLVAGKLCFTKEQNSALNMKVKTMQTNNNLYHEQGYKNRQDYLSNLAHDNGIDVSVVSQLAEMLGPDEDFDGLVANLDDFYFSFLGIE